MDPAELRGAPRPEFGIIGLGRFGTLAARILSPHGMVVAYDSRSIGAEASRLGIQSVPLAEAARARHVILCTPIRRLREVVAALRPHLLPRTILFDTCSVKTLPAGVLMQEVPLSVDVMATHPLFGPDSAAAGIRGLKIALCPLRRGRVRLARRFLEGLGLQVIVTDPEAHDRQIAETQAVVQWIGRALEHLAAGPREIDTTGHLRLLEILHYVARDSWELFRDIERLNPYAADARGRFLRALLEVEERIMDGFVVVFRAAGLAEAEIVKGYLEAQEIPVDLDYESAGPVMGLTMDGLGEVRVIVPVDWEETAREALARRPGNLPSSEKEGPADSDPGPNIA